jgi:guanylate kinase
MKYRRIILVGKGGSGKDYARKILVEKEGFRYCVSHTTRPPRNDEIEGKDYYFISDEKSAEMANNDEFYEYVKFNGWVYGTSNSEFYSSNLFIMTPSGISKIKKEDRKESYIFFLDIDLDVRKDRLNKRNDADKAERRLLTDYSDFLNFKDYDYSTNDPNFNIELFNLKSMIK